jgi:GNAT superfamily N-acetyltransferase
VTTSDVAKYMTINIRFAQPSDIEPLRSLNTQIFNAINQACDSDLIPNIAETEAGLKWMTTMVNRKDDGCCFVAESDGQLVGYVSGLKMDQFYRQSRWFEIDNLGVIEALRGQGIGKQLLNHAFTFAKDHGYQKVHVLCYAANKPACDFYLNQGFSQIDVSFEKDL